MALKKATLFKDFKIQANVLNTGVTFFQVSPKILNVKNDNFANQVEIFDTELDLFDYKYITFDNFSFFEIMDVIPNGKYTTLFIQYRSTLKSGFETEDMTFRIESVSVNKLRNLGLDINELVVALGESFNTNTRKKVNLIYAVKVRYSDLPKGRYGLQNGASESNFVPERKSSIFEEEYNETVFQLNVTYNRITDFAYSTYLIMPTGASSVEYVDLNNERIYSYNNAGFIYSLGLLMNDLVLSAEITVVNSKSIIYHSTASASSIVPVQYLDISLENDTIKVKIPYGTATPTTAFNGSLFKMIKAGDPATVWTACNLIIGTSSFDNTRDFVESMNYIEIDQNFATNEYPFSFFLMGNKIPLIQKHTENNKVVLKRDKGKIKVYTDILNNIYKEINTDYEYSKDAFSNFTAYGKSNIELVEEQKFTMQQQQRQQQREMERVGSISGSFTRAGAGLLMGGGFGGAGLGLLSAGADFAVKEMQFNMQQQNDIANAQLSKSQALERATKIIQPTSEISGSLTLFKAVQCEFEFFYLNHLSRTRLEKYVLENNINETFQANTQLLKPDYFNSKIIKVRIENNSPKNNRKGFYVYAEQ